MKSPSLENIVLIMGGLFSLLVIGLVVRFIYSSVSSKDNKKMYMKKKKEHAVMGTTKRKTLLSSLKGLKKK
tara:strand:- start:13728 stop:13940 length:213 start_codon:yes stop_codon:yes gene_type:complete